MTTEGENGTDEDDAYRIFRDHDDRFRFVCEAGHRVVQDEPNLHVCPAVTPWPGGDACGADIESRIIRNLTLTGTTEHDGGPVR